MAFVPFNIRDPLSRNGVAILFFLIIILYSLFYVHTSCAQSGEEWQSWNTVYGEKTVNQSWKISAEEETHLGEDIGKFLYYHTDVGVIYAVSGWLNCGVNYRFIRAINDDLWENEHRPYFSATVLATWQAITLSNKSRMEQRILSHTKDFWRYRNQTKFAVNLKAGERSITPYFSHESFFDLDQPEFNFFQFAGGVETEITKNLSIDFYYLRQDGGGRGTEPKTNVVGLGARIYF